jgi:hypothetical protein
MAGRSKNATPRVFPRVFSELLYKEIWGGRGPEQIIFLKSVQNDERSPEILKKWGVFFSAMKHKSGHKFSTRDFSDKLMLDLDSPPYLAPKNKVVSLNKFLRTPCFHLPLVLIVTYMPFVVFLQFAIGFEFLSWCILITTNTFRL